MEFENTPQINEDGSSGGTLLNMDIVREMKNAYLDYSMTVIISRALPDVRDGLKPVHRRILYTMYENNLTPDKAYRKCADTVGAVLGRYHPHGDASVIIPTATLRCMTRWSGWRRPSPCAMCWWTDTATSVRWTATRPPRTGIPNRA